MTARAAPVAFVTGASRGIGKACAPSVPAALAARKVALERSLHPDWRRG